MREPRENIKGEDLLFPVDIFKLGSKDDPCFGKLHDLKHPACSVCGDADFCAIVKAQNMHIKRTQIESEGRFKDKEEAEFLLEEKTEKVKQYIEECTEKGLPKSLILVRGKVKFNLTKELMREIYESLIKE